MPDPDSTTGRQQEYITAAGIKEKHGLTSAFIARLGNPDKIATNPHYKSASPMKLYKIDRVEQLIADLKETDPGFFEKMERRREAAAKSVSTKRDSMDKLASELIASLVIRDYDAKKIPARAKRQFLEHEMATRGDDWREWHGGVNANIAFIRHELTNYHDVLDKIARKVGAGDAYERIKAALNSKIVEDYERRLGRAKERHEANTGDHDG